MKSTERGLEERKAISVFAPDHLKQIKELTETAETHLECQRFPLTEKEAERERERFREREKERGTMSERRQWGRWNLTEEKIDFLG